MLLRSATLSATEGESVLKLFGFLSGVRRDEDSCVDEGGLGE